MADVSTLYAEGRGRIAELVTKAGPEGAGASVPTCPGWRVHDVVAHLAGVCADILSGNIADVATDPWTAAQVEARKDRATEDVVAEWNELAPQVEAFAQHFPGRVGDQWVLDLTTHEHDVRLALGEPGERDSEAVRLGADFMVGGFGGSLRARGLGPIEIRAGDVSWIVGGGEPAGDEDAIAAAADSALSAAVLSGEPITADGPPVAMMATSFFDLMRALTGRRSAAQIAGYSWTVDPAPYVASFQFGPFSMSPVDVDE